MKIEPGDLVMTRRGHTGIALEGDALLTLDGRCLLRDEGTTLVAKSGAFNLHKNLDHETGVVMAYSRNGRRAS